MEKFLILRHKKEIRRISILVILTFLIILSNLPRNIDTATLSNDDKSNNYNEYNEKSEPLESSEIKNMANYINGTGVDQTVRLFMSNESQSHNNEGYFNISSPAQVANLSSADLYFNFGNNYTTEYVVEDDSALYPDPLLSYFEDYQYKDTSSYIDVHDGTESPINGFDDLINDNENEFNISSNNGIANFPASLAVGGFVTMVSASVLILIPGLVDTLSFAVVMIIGSISILWFLFTPNN